MTPPGPAKSAASSAAAGPWCSCEERRPATMTLASRAVAPSAFSLPTLADLSENLVDRRRGERRSFFGGHRNPEGASLDNPDLAGKRLDLNLPLLDRNPQRHPRKDPGLVTDRFGEDKPAGRVDGRLNGISHGCQNTMSDSGGSGNLLEEAFRHPEAEPGLELSRQGVVFEVARLGRGGEGLSDGGAGEDLLQQGVLGGGKRVAPHHEVAAGEGQVLGLRIGNRYLLGFLSFPDRRVVGV